MVAGDYADDKTIPNNSVLLRRRPAVLVVYDDNLQRKRPSSGAFKDNPRGPMSVYMSSECGGYQKLLEGNDGFGVASFSAQLARDLGLGLSRDEANGGPGHVLVVGKKTKRILNALAKEAEWVVLPAGMQGEAS